jgi:NhaA family Na+:H+ antiporter
VLLLFILAALLLFHSPWADPFPGAWETPVGLRIGVLEFARSLRT